MLGDFYGSDTLLEFGTGCYVRVVGLTNIDPLADDVILI